jgi:hypothetical protein
MQIVIKNSCFHWLNRNVSVITIQVIVYLAVNDIYVRLFDNINTIRMDSVISAAGFDVVVAVVVSDEVSMIGGDDQRRLTGPLERIR